MKVLAITSYKGGVAKTTTAINLAAALAELGHRVLLADTDQQANTTWSLGFPKDLPYNVGAFLTASVREVRQWPMQQVSERLALLPSHRFLDEYLVAAERKPNYEQLLRDRLALLPAGSYDYVVIDCPPALHAMTWNALVAADGYLVPLEPEAFAVEGLSELMLRAAKVKETTNPQLHLVGLVFTRYNPATPGQLRQHLAGEVEAAFSADMLGHIRPNVSISEAQNERQTVLAFAPKSVGAKEYRALTQKVLSRL